MRIQMLALATAATGALLTGSPAHAQGWANETQQARFQLVDHRSDHRRGYHGRVWRDEDGRYRCRRHDGTVGLLVGGVAGALIGREIDGGRDRTAGTLIGGAAGALIGREIDRSNSRCQ